MLYDETANGLSFSHAVGEYRFRYDAHSIRRERTGIHALVSIHIQDTMLAFSEFNIGRDEDRVRLANSAFKHLGSDPPLSANELKHDLDMFCVGLWPRFVQSRAPRLCAGTSPEPVRFYAEPYVMEAGSTICFAPPGRGKSYMLLLLAVSIDAGVNDLWRVQKAPALIINLERSEQTFNNRLGCVNRALGLPIYRPLHILHARGWTLADIVDAAAQHLDTNGPGPVFLDSISRAGFGDLNDNRPANAISDSMNQLATSWFGLAHTPRGDESHVYGSVHFDAAADIMLQLSGVQEEADGPMGVSLQIVKANDIGRIPQFIYHLDFDAAGLYAVRDAIDGEFPTLEQNEHKSLRTQLRDYVQASGGQANATEAARDLGALRQKVWGLLQEQKSYVKLAKNGKEQAYGLRLTGT